MSRTGFFVCFDCKVRFFLGQAVMRKEDSGKPKAMPLLYDKGLKTARRNSEDRDMTRTLWKMLADHSRHDLRVVVEWDEDYDAAIAYPEIGGETFDDIPFKEYLKDWDG